MKLSEKVRCREKIVKAIKTDLPVEVGGCEILDVDNCDFLNFKIRLKYLKSRDKDCAPSSPGYTDAFAPCPEDPESLTLFVAQGHGYRKEES